MDISTKLLDPTLGFLITLIFGFWLSRRGRPYKGLLFNIHKLVDLGTVILGGMAAYQLLKVTDVEILIILLFAVTTLNNRFMIWIRPAAMEEARLLTEEKVKFKKCRMRSLKPMNAYLVERRYFNSLRHHGSGLF